MDFESYNIILVNINLDSEGESFSSEISSIKNKNSEKINFSAPHKNQLNLKLIQIFTRSLSNILCKNNKNLSKNAFKSIQNYTNALNSSQNLKNQENNKTAEHIEKYK